MTKKIVSWDDLENAEDVFSKTVFCPNLSKAMGKEVHVKVRAIDHMEFLAAIDMPIDDINLMVADDAEPGAFSKAIQEQATTLSLKELLETQETIIKIGLIDPDPTGGNLRKLTIDFNTIFAAISKLSMPAKGVAEAGKFPADGE